METDYPDTRSLVPRVAILNTYEKMHNSTLRKKALDMCLDHIRFEDRYTKWICIGPVNKAFNMLSIFFAEGPDSENFKNHQARIDDYLWLAADGMKMQGYNGSQLWDTAFSVQALVESGLTDAHVMDSLQRAYVTKANNLYLSRSLGFPQLRLHRPHSSA